MNKPWNMARVASKRSLRKKYKPVGPVGDPLNNQPRTWSQQRVDEGYARQPIINSVARGEPRGRSVDGYAFSEDLMEGINPGKLDADMEAMRGFGMGERERFTGSCRECYEVNGRHGISCSRNMRQGRDYKFPVEQGIDHGHRIMSKEEGLLLYPNEGPKGPTPQFQVIAVNEADTEVAKHATDVVNHMYQGLDVGLTYEQFVEWERRMR